MNGLILDSVKIEFGRLEANHKRILTIKNKLRVAGREVFRGWVIWVMGTDGTCDVTWAL